MIYIVQLVCLSVTVVHTQDRVTTCMYFGWWDLGIEVNQPIIFGGNCTLCMRGACNSSNPPIIVSYIHQYFYSVEKYTCSHISVALFKVYIL